MNVLHRDRAFLRSIVFVVIVASGCLAQQVAELIDGSDTYYPADRVVRFVAERLSAAGFVPVLIVSVLSGALAAALVSQSRGHDV
jgi:hypothetical protein